MAQNKQKWVVENRDRRRQQQRNWYLRNAARISAHNKSRQSERVMANREYYKKFPEKHREKILKCSYGITLSDYNLMLQQQNECCAICSVHYTKCRRGNLCVDHCHSTGKIRGLLCENCNYLLGHGKDSVEILQKAAKYLMGGQSFPT